MAQRSLKRYSLGDRFLVLAMLVLCFITLYPVWYTIIISFNDSTDSLLGESIGFHESLRFKVI